ncbi:MAG: type II secretion system GspH family protein [Gemmatimonadota bacterium]|nr:type II secretion system GspH family protein [Gemmatimonadota bacterium]
MRNTKGFVLVEALMNGLAVGALLAVLALMCVQSAIALPRWTEARTQAHFNVLEWDLENLRARQALHFADQQRYSSDLEALRFTPSSGVELEISASPWGWSATASHSGLSTSEGCAIFVGTALPPDAPVMPAHRGAVTCSEESVSP